MKVDGNKVMAWLDKASAWATLQNAKTALVKAADELDPSDPVLDHPGLSYREVQVSPRDLAEFKAAVETYRAARADWQRLTGLK